MMYAFSLFGVQTLYGSHFLNCPFSCRRHYTTW